MIPEKSERKRKQISLSRNMGAFLIVTFSLLFTILSIQIGILSGIYRRNWNQQVQTRLNAYVDRMEGRNEQMLGAQRALFASSDFERLAVYQKEDTKNPWDNVWNVRSQMEQAGRSNGNLAAAFVYYGGNANYQYYAAEKLPYETIRKMAETGKIVSNGQSYQNFSSAVIRTEDNVYYGIFLQKGTAVLAEWTALSEDIPTDMDYAWGVIRDGVYESLTGMPEELRIGESALQEGRNRIDGRIVFARKSSAMNLTFVVSVPDTIFLYISRMELMAAILVLALIPLTIFLYRFIRQRLIDPLEDLTRAVQTINQGDWTLTFAQDTHVMEIANIRQALNTLLGEIEEYKIKVYEEKLARQNIQLQYLRLRLTPHFYTNCLKNAYYMLELGEYDSAQKFLLCMSRHLRYLLRSNVEKILLKDELSFVDNYIEMQRFLVSSRILYSAETEGGVENAEIPILTLETFVENSIKYARSGKEKELRIALYIKAVETEQGKYLDIVMMDSGGGYSREQLERMNHPDFGDTNVSGGIQNLLSRLKIYYGDRASWYFHNNSTDGGAVSEIILPLLLKSGEEDGQGKVQGGA